VGRRNANRKDILKLIGCGHVGLIGDALYALPTIRELCKKHDCKADFYTSPHCAPMKSLILYQDCINDFIVTKEFDNECNVKPWKVGFRDIPDGKYDAFYDLSFHSFPDRPLPKFIADNAGVELGPIKYQCPNDYLPMNGYYVFAPRANQDRHWGALFRELSWKTDKPVIFIGGKGEMTGGSKGFDTTGNDMLRMTELIAGSDGFIGVPSAPLVIAHGFDIPKVVIHDGRNFGHMHVVRDDFTKYLINPTAEQVLKALK